MFTWNFKHISRARLAETFNQLMLNTAKGDILIRIHTAIHTEEEAVDLARFIKNLVPRAHIFGTSTSSVIYNGKLLPNQCVISVTQMEEAHIDTALLPTYDYNSKEAVHVDELCKNVGKAVVKDNTKLMLAFLTRRYLDVHKFVENSNTWFPGVQMIGGIANTPEISMKRSGDSGYVFDECQWSDTGIILASFSGDELGSFSSCATGVEVIGNDMEITDTFGRCILSIDGKDAAEVYRMGVGDELNNQSELTNLFPFVYSDASDIPIFVRFSDDMSMKEAFPEDDPYNMRNYESHPDLDRDKKMDMIKANHNVEKGKKIRRAFIYDQKIISDNRALFRRVENFEKDETIFGYSSISRSMIYANCVKWELAAYENSNMCGCLTEGEIAHVNGKNTFANCSFVVSVMGENKSTQRFNPYAFTRTDTLAKDNEELINYLIAVEQHLAESDDRASASALQTFVRDCELKILYSESAELQNSAAMKMDIEIRGIDRICMINVLDASSFLAVFGERLTQLTKKSFRSKCESFAKNKGYHIYSIEEWTLAIGAPSYMVSLSDFASNMENLQRELFRTTGDYISIVPVFCVIDNCTTDNLFPFYNSVQAEMRRKNVQFYVCDEQSEQQDQQDQEEVRDIYNMVKVIKQAIAEDRVIPYYHGIYDNHNNRITHYESLMRLEDENGRLYYPNEFLDIARQFGLLYDSLSMMMVKKVFEQFKDFEETSVSINLGIRDIRNKEMVDFIFDFLSTAKHPEHFVFEILENEDIDSYERIITFVDRLHALGAKVSLDDFGSGFSNLKHLLNIRFDYLKIDGSIVRHCYEEPDSESIIAIISSWKVLSKKKITIIAEYVENEDIQNMLRNYDIDYSQGYLFSKPDREVQGE